MDRLRQLRDGRELSQQALADRVGVSRTAIAQYETGVRRPTGDILVRLARVLGVPSAYLLGQTDSQERDDRLPDDWVAVVEDAMADGFSPEDVKRAIAMLKLALDRTTPPQGQQP